MRDLHQRDAIGAQFDRVDRDLISLDKAADRGDFSDAMGLGELVANVPILNRAQLSQRFILGQERVLINPTNASGIGADLRRHAFGHPTGGEVEVFEHPRACPVDIRAVLKNNIDKGRAKE